jgi:hypothetical protein
VWQVAGTVAGATTSVEVVVGGAHHLFIRFTRAGRTQQASTSVSHLRMRRGVGTKNECSWFL